MRIKKCILIVLGTISMGLGIVGIFLPILPSTPLLILTLFCYANGSTKFHNWFISTRLYKNHIEEFIMLRAMTRLNKIRVLATVTVLLTMPIIFINSILIRIILIFVITVHYFYFLFRVKTIPVVKKANTESGLKSTSAD